MVNMKVPLLNINLETWQVIALLAVLVILVVLAFGKTLGLGFGLW